MRRLLWLSGLAAVYAACVWVVQPDLARLWAGLPRLAGWLSGAFPPDFSGLADLLRRAAETVAIATLGTTLAALLALPLAVVAARPVAPLPALYHPARALLDALRGVDGFVFALIFVAAVGLGPFAGTLGVALHSAGSIGKLWSEALEAADLAPVEAALTAGASRAQAAAAVLLPETLPQTASAALYVWEFNIRAVEARQCVRIIQLGPGDVVHAEPAPADDRKDLLDPHLSRVVGLEGAARHIAAVEGREHQRLEDRLVGVVKGAVEEDAFVVGRRAGRAFRHPSGDAPPPRTSPPDGLRNGWRAPASGQPSGRPRAASERAWSPPSQPGAWSG
jgi:phosphonate transport system permease protein